MKERTIRFEYSLGLNKRNRWRVCEWMSGWVRLTVRPPAVGLPVTQTLITD